MIGGNDGGVDLSLNGGETWYAPPLPISQFYRIGVDNRNPYHVSGTMQDLGSIAGPSNSLSGSGISLADWYSVGGGEAGYTLHDPSDPNIVYAGEYAGVITRYDHRTRQARMVGSYVDNPSGHGAADMKYRFRWPAPIAGSPHDPKIIYHAANVLFRTVDGGQTWTPISPDLTRNDKRRQQWSGGPITGDNTTAEYYCTISAVAESPKEKGLIWVGSDDGLVHFSRDAGKSWNNVTEHLLGLPEWATIKMIEPSPFDAAVALVVVDAHMIDDMHPFLYRTRDHGKRWTLLSGSMPQDVPLHVVREDPKKKGLLYVGTERGVVFSGDDGKTWQSLQLNLPTVPVHDLIVKGDDLVVGSHGRSIWIFDDLTPIRIFGPAIANKPVDLLPPLTATRWRFHGSISALGRGDNPPAGAVIHFWLKDKPKTKPKLEVLDADGKMVRVLAKVTEPEPTAVEKEGAAGERTRRRRARGQGKGRRAGGRIRGRGGSLRRTQEAEATRQAGTASRGLGPGTRSGPADQERQDRLRQSRDRPSGSARQVHREAHRGWPDRDGPSGIATRSARQGRAGRPCRASSPRRWPSATISTSSPERSSSSGRFASNFRIAVCCSRKSRKPGRWRKPRPNWLRSSTPWRASCTIPRLRSPMTSWP